KTSIDLHNCMHFYPTKNPVARCLATGLLGCKWWQGRGSNSRHLVFQRVVTGLTARPPDGWRALRITAESRLYLSARLLADQACSRYGFRSPKAVSLPSVLSFPMFRKWEFHRNSLMQSPSFPVGWADVC